MEAGAIAAALTAASGRRATLEILGAGDIAGEVSSPTDAVVIPINAGSLPVRPRDAPLSFLPELRALVPSRLLFVASADLREALCRDPELHSWVTSRLNVRIESLGRRLAATLTLPVPDRLLAVLEDLASTHARRTSEGRRIDLPVNQDTLASMVGATRESVNRAMRGLARRGLVRRIGRSYLVSTEEE